MNSFDYQQVDSNALRALEATTRKKLIAKLHLTGPYKTMTLEQVRANLKTTTTQTIFIQEYYSSERYKMQEEVVDEITRDPSLKAAFSKRSVNAMHFAISILFQPVISIYQIYAEKMITVIEDSIDNDHYGTDVEEDLRKLVAIHIDYANAHVDMFEEWNFATSDKLEEELKPLLWNTDVIHNGQTDSTPISERTDFTEFDRIHSRLIEVIERSDPMIMQYMISPTFGSYGTALLPITLNPILVKILPQPLSISQGKSILEASFEEPLHQAILEVKRTPDRILQILESIAQKAIDSTEVDDIRDGILRWSTGLDQQDRGKGENSPSSFHSSFGEPTSPRPNRQQQSTGRRQTNQQQQQQQQTPDDDNYQPDALLASLAAAHTRLVQANPAAFATQDHMTRFSTTSEAPSTLSRAQLKSSDYYIMKRDRYGNQMFLVTYTRKSKKPIFSYIA